MTNQIVDKISFQPLEHQVAGFFLEKIIIAHIHLINILFLRKFFWERSYKTKYKIRILIIFSFVKSILLRNTWKFRW